MYSCERSGQFRVFFFKQKKAYEMRISDWSSDVCSSDLPTDTVEGLIETSVTTDDEVYVRGMFNTPLAQGIRLRVTGFYQNLDEQVDNLYGDDDYGLRAYGVRAKLAFDLAENATFTDRKSTRLNSSN